MIINGGYTDKTHLRGFIFLILYETLCDRRSRKVRRRSLYQFPASR
ncbi:hypothetical protein [Nostoc sp.]|nr:hypothetical protein [uncultured Nostoc sp.]